MKPSNNQFPESDLDPASSAHWLRLWISMATIAGVWLVVLPCIARQPAVKDRMDTLEEKGIDPSAMFYTELDAMDPILRRLENR